MRFGFFTTLGEPTGKLSYTQLLRDLREQAALCDRAGFEHVWLAEHHFGPEGMGNTPNPILLGADIAARTERVRIGMAAVILPWWHPIRAAEDLALLDQLSEGRLDVAVGRGVWPREGPNFHPKADPRDGAANSALFEECLTVMKQCWTEEFFAHEGPNYTFPAPGMQWKHPMFPDDTRWREGDRITRLQVTPRPFQQPHPPLWQVCSSPNSIGFSARNGMNALIWQPPPKRIRELGDLYAELRGKAEGRSVDPRKHLGVLRQIHVAPSMEQAIREGAEAASFFHLYNNPFRGLAMFMNPGEQPTPDMQMGFEFLQQRGGVMVGTPEYVAERLNELREVAGVDYVLPDMALPFLSQKQILASMELFAERVMPLLENPR